MKRVKLLLILTLVAFAVGCGGGDSSTPELCQQACERWAACTGSPGYYPMDVCMPDCQAEGDWDSSYVECLQNNSSCADMEANCG